MAVGLLTLPMNRMLLVDSSRMKTRKGRSSLMVSGMLMGKTSMVVLAAAVVPFSSTFSTARWDTCGGTQRILKIYSVLFKHDHIPAVPTTQTNVKPLLPWKL